MSFKNALSYLEMVREDEDLRCEVAAIAGGSDIRALAVLARQRGFECDSSELIKAWRKQYALRQVVAQLKRS